LAFALALLALRRESSLIALSDRQVTAFSNYARAAVPLLIVTGLYAAWLEVGSVEALLRTVYGQALLVKLILFLPLLAVAGINLLPLPVRATAAALTGMALLGVVGFLIAQQRPGSSAVRGCWRSAGW
jgi:putative copper export protein